MNFIVTVYKVHVAIEDFRFSDQFNCSIEAKVKAEQEALQAVNEKSRFITGAETAYEKARPTNKVLSLFRS